MKLTHIALILTLGLLGLTGWFAWTEHNSATSARNKLDLYERHGQPEPAMEAREDQLVMDALRRKTGAGGAASGSVLPATAPVSSAPVQPALPPVSYTPPPLPQTPPAGVPSTLANSPHISQSSLTAQPPPLTEQQRQVRAAPAIAQISQYQQQYGFVVVTAGKNRRLESGMSFAVRHDGFIVGRIKITEVEQDSAVGDLDGTSVPNGVTIEPGDDIIQDFPGA